MDVRPETALPLAGWWLSAWGFLMIYVSFSSPTPPSLLPETFQAPWEVCFWTARRALHWKTSANGRWRMFAALWAACLAVLSTLR